MKTIVKIEIVILVLVVLVAAVMTMWDEGVFGLLKEPVVMERTPEPIPQETEVQEEALPQAPVQEEAPAENLAEEARELTAKSWFVFDTRQGEYLQTQGDVHAKLYPASITKLLTCHTLLSCMDPEDTVTVGDALTLVKEDSSVAGLQTGDVITVEQLVCAMMLPSGNDAAQVAAVAGGRALGGQNLNCREAAEVFVEQMNTRAEELGMEDSHFVNPDGWHNENHYTSMNDLVTLTQKVLTNPVILKYTSMPSATVQLGDRELEWKNTNMLLHERLDTYTPSTIGMKTGYTNAAGDCLVTAFFETDRIILVGVFGCPRLSEDRYLDTIQIYNSL